MQESGSCSFTDHLCVAFTAQIKAGHPRTEMHCIAADRDYFSIVKSFFSSDGIPYFCSMGRVVICRRRGDGMIGPR